MLNVTRGAFLAYFASWSLYFSQSSVASSPYSAENHAAKASTRMATYATAEKSPACVENAINIADSDALIFRVTPEQRQMLFSTSNPEEFALKFQDFIRHVRKAFDTEGVVVVRGLLEDDLLDRLEKDSQAIMDNSAPAIRGQFVSLNFGPAFSDTAFREAALSSAIPRFIAMVLLQMKGGEDGDHEGRSTSASLHLLKDAFFAKGGEKKCCGWHVDDVGFWPTDARSRPGVNAWIAIDDIPAEFGGGLAVSPRSHNASWRERAYEAIGSTRLYPEEGLAPGMPFGKTCDMEEADPDLAKTIDGTKKVFDFRRGDVLFHTRWLFHRSMPLTSDGEERFQRLDMEPTFKRYSIRYEYADSRLLKGINVEFAALLNPENKGRTLAEVNKAEGPFYPKCWPGAVSDNDIDRMDDLVREKFPIAEARRKELFKTLMQGNTAKK